jgi:hypothetical protein
MDYTAKIFTLLAGSTAVLHCDRCAAFREEHTNFADVSACLTADNVRNKVVTIHGSQEVLKMLSLYTQISFAINCFVKKHRYNNTSCTFSTPGTNFHWMERNFVG